jgi:hypothetical protein
VGAVLSIVTYADLSDVGPTSFAEFCHCDQWGPTLALRRGLAPFFAVCGTEQLLRGTLPILTTIHQGSLQSLDRVDVALLEGTMVAVVSFPYSHLTFSIFVVLYRRWWWWYHLPWPLPIEGDMQATTTKAILIQLLQFSHYLPTNLEPRQGL